MFESWLEQEKTSMKAGFKRVRIMYIVCALLVGPYMLFMLIAILGGSKAGVLAAVIVFLILLYFMLSLSDYKRRFLKPLMALIQQELPTEEARQEFGSQMLTEAVHIFWQPRPQPQPRSKYKIGSIFVAKNYCYVRLPKVCIIKNCEIRRVELFQEDYAAGSIGRLRVSLAYGLALYTAENDQKPVWKGYFANEGELYQAFAHFRPLLPQETVILDEVAAGEIRIG